MSMPHTCRCEKCGREMPPFPGAVIGYDMAQPGADSVSYWCTKHGRCFGPDCEQCKAETVSEGK